MPPTAILCAANKGSRKTQRKSLSCRVLQPRHSCCKTLKTTAWIQVEKHTFFHYAYFLFIHLTYIWRFFAVLFLLKRWRWDKNASKLMKTHDDGVIPELVSFPTHSLCFLSCLPCMPLTMIGRKLVQLWPCWHVFSLVCSFYLFIYFLFPVHGYYHVNDQLLARLLLLFSCTCSILEQIEQKEYMLR